MTHTRACTYNKIFNACSKENDERPWWCVVFNYSIGGVVVVFWICITCGKNHNG